MTSLRKTTNNAVGLWWKTWAAVLTTLVLAASMVPSTASADIASELGEFIVEGGTEGVDYDYDPERIGNVLTIKREGDFSITLPPGHISNGSIVVKANATITLKDVAIRSQMPTAPIVVEGYDVTLILVGKNSVTQASYSDSPGIYKGRQGTLTIKGEGSIEASASGIAAGIGGGSGGYLGDDKDCANVHIESGTVLARGGSTPNIGAAGIGGALDGSGSNIVISGGNVQAWSDFGAGIGGGSGGKGSSITVSGGSLESGSYLGAGIGGGYQGTGEDITVSGGTVKAASESGAGIGGGYQGAGGGITLSGGTVTATGYVGIGSGEDALSADDHAFTQVKVEGGEVDATGLRGPGIGASENGGKAEIAISGGIVKATGGANSPGIGVGFNSTGCSIAISGGTVSSEGGDGCLTDLGANDADLPAGTFSTTICGGSVYAPSAKPTPVYAPEGEADAVELRRVEYDIASDAEIDRANLVGPSAVPSYYGLNGVMRDEEGKIHLWLDKNLPLSSSGTVGSAGLCNVTLTPGKESILLPSSHLVVEDADPNPALVEACVFSLPDFQDAKLEEVPQLELDYDVAKTPEINGIPYAVGMVFSQDGKEFVVYDAPGDGSFAYAELPADGGSLKGDAHAWLPDGAAQTAPNAQVTAFKRSEGGQALVMNDVEYRAIHSVELRLPSGTSETRELLYTPQGEPAGYRSARSVVFNEGMDPNSLMERRGDACLPARQFENGNTKYLVYAPFVKDISLVDGDPTSSSLSIAATVFLPASKGTARWSAIHQVENGFHSATRVTGSAGEVTEGVVPYDTSSSYDSIENLSPFALTAVVENKVETPVVHVDAWPHSDQAPARPLARTGDNAASSSTVLAMLASAACACAALAAYGNRRAHQRQ